MSSCRNRPPHLGRPVRPVRRALALLLLPAPAIVLPLGGCTSDAPAVPATQPVTAIDARLARPDYWYAQPATATVVAGNFDALWSAADAAARTRFFPIDRRDVRGGLMTTEPMVSKQWFEPWRQDVLEGDALADSSLATIRRTVRYEFERRDDGSFAVTPKVLIERYSVAENRVTSVVLYRAAFRAGRTTDQTAYGTRETDRGVYLPSRYWYAVGRDVALEQALAGDIQRRIGTVTTAAPPRPGDAVE